MQSVNQRYLFKPFPGSSHSWALNFLCGMDTKARLLDVGIGSAGLARELKSSGFGELFGVEPDSQARNLAQDVYQRLDQDLSGFKGELFQIILLMDVLEHCSEPEQVLQTCVELLSPGGYMLISVPNIAHWSVRIPLLFGEFKYRERGILDRTHLRFFTRQSFREFLNKEAALDLVELRASIAPFELALPRPIWDNSLFGLLSEARISLANTFPGLLGYQHLALLRRKAAAR